MTSTMETGISNSDICLHKNTCKLLLNCQWLILTEKEGGDFILLYEVDFTSFHSELILVRQHLYIIETYI